MRFPLYLRIILIGILLFCLLFITLYIRIQGVEQLQDGQFTENDAFLYQWMADEIAENGTLPPRDTHRWLPLGRDNAQLLPLYSYAITYTHKALVWLFPALTRYHIQLYITAICFTLGLGVLFLFLVRSHGLLFASIISVLLATLPGSVERSAAGFGDRDAWCWMFGVLAIVVYLWKEQIPLNLSIKEGRREPEKERKGISNWYRYLATALAGFIVFLGGLSWESFGIFVLIILCAELWKFCTTETESHLKEYLIWMLMFVPGLYLISPAYRSGYTYATHLAAFTLAPPVAVFIMHGLRYLLLKYYPPLRSHARKLAGGLTLFGIGIGIGYMLLQSGTFENTAFIFQENRLMKDMTELVDPNFGYWPARYGTVFMLGSLGLILGSLYLWKQNGIPLATALSLFTATTFFRWPLSELIGEGSCDTLFLVSLGLTAITLAIACFRKETAKNELVTVIMVVWFLFWVALSRGAKRYDFFIGVPLAFGTAWLLWQLPATLAQQFKKPQWIPATIAIAVLIPVLFWTPLGGHANMAVPAAAYWRKPLPGTGDLAQALNWINTELSQGTVMAANWSYGSRLNVFGGVKTITDQDTFLPHWIHLYYRHVYCAQDVREALEFLKTHGATHLMLRKWGLINKANTYSYIGSDENSDRRFGLTRLVQLGYKRLSKIEETPFLYIEEPDITSPPDFITARLKEGGIARLPYVAFKGNKRHIHKTSIDDNPHGNVILYYDEKDDLEKAYHISNLGWQSLAVRLYFLGDFSDIFVPIYPTNGEDTAPLKVWEIHYPPGIETDDKYLAIEPSEQAKE